MSAFRTLDLSQLRQIDVVAVSPGPLQTPLGTKDRTDRANRSSF
ncbi:hypothetical protein RE6C_04990 [Rhodopirellula europaea 6C]|uniref:Uncharacterized protein n=1 Tax=Rhodopirellula europaea 6C TaxID=1263867 RepID=M2AYF7_9BACT|nr:hypothetical protein RE6C_04990 [Rhodopirellula europaea 6C]